MTVGHPAHPAFRDALTSESLKARWSSTTALGLAVIAVLGLGVGAGLAAVADPGAITATQADNQFSVIFYSASFVTWAYAFLAASITAGDLRGPGAATFTATARRTRVLAAKLTLVAAGAIVVGLAVSVLTVAATQGVLAARGIETLDLTDPGLLRAVALFLPASLLVQGLLAACVAILVRSVAGGVAVTALFTLAPVSLAPALGDGFAATVPRWVPGAAVESLAGIPAPTSYGYLPWPWALGCVSVWLALACAAAAVRLHRTDIRS